MNNHVGEIKITRFLVLFEFPSERNSIFRAKTTAFSKWLFREQIVKLVYFWYIKPIAYLKNIGLKLRFLCLKLMRKEESNASPYTKRFNIYALLHIIDRYVLLSFLIISQCWIYSTVLFQEDNKRDYGMFIFATSP